MTNNNNAKLDCYYCPKDKDVQIFSSSLFNHTISKHFDAFLCGTTKTAENNRKALKNATKFNPVELHLNSFATYYCCLKCNKAVVKESMCRHYHFNPDETTKNHKTEHLQGCKDLLQKALVRMEELKATQEATIIAEPTPTGDGVKVVEKIVEKIVYVDRPVGNCDPGAILKVLGAVVNDCYKNDFYTTQLEKTIEHLYQRCLKADAIVQKKNILIGKLSITSSLSPFNRKQLEIECDETVIVPNDKRLKDEINDIKSAVVRKDIYDPYDEHEELLNELKVYIPNLTLSTIRKHLPKDNNDD